MALRTRLKKLEGTLRPSLVVDSPEDRANVCRRLGISPWGSPQGAFVWPPWAGAPDSDEPYPPTYRDFVGRGVIVETDRYVASVRSDDELAAEQHIEHHVARWRSLRERRPAEAFDVARALDRAVTATPPEPGYRPSGLVRFLPMSPTDPSVVTVAQHHAGALEAAGWAAAFESDCPEAYAAWSREREAREAEERERAAAGLGLRRRSMRSKGLPYEPEDYDAAREAVGPVAWPEPRTPRSDRLAHEAWTAEVEGRAETLAVARGYTPASPAPRAV